MASPDKRKRIQEIVGVEIKEGEELSEDDVLDIVAPESAGDVIRDIDDLTPNQALTASWAVAALNEPNEDEPHPGPEFVAKAVRRWIEPVGAKTAYIEHGSPWENCYVENCNARLRDELLDGEAFFYLAEAKTVIEAWRRQYNTTRPHSALR